MTRVSSRPSTLPRRLAIAAAVVAVSLLGNLRLQASETHTDRTTSDANVLRAAPLTPQKTETLLAEGRAPARDHVFERVGLAEGAGLDVDAIADGSADRDAPADVSDDDDGQFVPAIYAWDPDVRFVYYRHVSKWM